ncbi:MAG: hypothetical protein KDK70_31555, partial [Myxococcales bacterium]|nr:hypothetical protein [Myxococcales bacterium]
MSIRPALAIGLLAALGSAPAHAGPTVDLAVDIAPTAAALVYDDVAYDVVVSNLSNKRADDVVLTISLPQTNTSPTVHVMGTLGAFDPRCTPSGTALVCALGSLGRGASTTVWLDLALPQADEVLDVVASVTTSNVDGNPANDADAEVTPLLHYAVPLLPGDAAHVRHCTGQGLTAFFECTLFPGSITAHDIELLAGGVVSIVGQPDYTGTWSQPTPDHLLLTYETGGNVVAQFEGWGANADCFEGLTTFPGSAYVAPYEVCRSGAPGGGAARAHPPS